MNWKESIFGRTWLAKLVMVLFALIVGAAVMTIFLGCASPSAPTAAELLERNAGAPLDQWSAEDRAAYHAAVHGRAQE